MQYLIDNAEAGAWVFVELQILAQRDLKWQGMPLKREPRKFLLTKASQQQLTN